MAQYNYINSSGAIAFLAAFDEASAFDAFGWAGVRRGDQSIYINVKGEIVLTSKFKNQTFFNVDGLGILYHAIKGRDLYGIITAQDEWLLPPRYEGLGLPTSGVICASAGRKHEVLDSVGRHLFDIAPYRFDDSYNFSDGLVLVKKMDEYSFINLCGEVTLGPFWSAQLFCDGLAYVKSTEGSKPVFIDVEGNIVLNTLDYDYVSEYWSEGLLHVVRNGKHGLISKQNQFLIEPMYDKIEELCNGYFIVVKGTERTVVYRDATIVLPVPTDITMFRRASEGFVTYEKAHKWGYLQLSNGAMVTPAIYDDAGFVRYGLAPVCLSQSEK